MSNPNAEPNRFAFVENYIAFLVKRRIVEDVHVEVRKYYVGILPNSRQGTFILAMFWTKILQHPSNFPIKEFNYRKSRSGQESGIGSEVIYVLVEDVEISVDTRSGALEIRGEDAHNWFLTRFPEIIRNYDGYMDSRTQYADSPNDKKELEKLFINENGYLKVLYPTAEIVTPLEESHLRKLSVGDELNRILNGIQTPVLKSGEKFIYHVWKSLLNRWLSDERITVYGATRQIDTQRLRDLFDLCLLHKLTGNVEVIYVPQICDGDAQLSEVRHEACRKYSSDEKLWIEAKILNHIRTPKKRQIGCNFIAGYLPDQQSVYLLLTSATFHAGSLSYEESLHSVQYLTMPYSEYKQNFLQPIQSSTQDDPRSDKYSILL